MGANGCRLAGLTVLVVLAGLLARPSAEEPADQFRETLRSAGVQAGLAVHVGTSDGMLECELVKGGRRLVHGLALDDTALAASRRAIQERGLYGLASVEKAARLDPLPYADNL